jgi:hypothetical protein
MFFNQFFFLHIPKTGGRYFNHSVVESLKPSFLKKNISLIKKEVGHKGWDTDINNNTYVTTIFRDPAEQLVSLFAHEPDSDILNKNSFFEWFEKNNTKISNFQAKNFLLTDTRVFIDILDININSVNDIRDRLDRVNLLIKYDSLKKIGYNVIVDKISSDMGINNFSHYVNLSKEEFKNINSLKIFNSLNQFEKNKIYNISPIDLEIYNSDRFWSPK